MKKTILLTFSVFFALIVVLAGCDDSSDSKDTSKGNPVCSPTATLPAAFVTPEDYTDVDSSGDLSNGDTSEMAGTTVVYNNGYWQYSVTDSCVALKGATVVNAEIELVVAQGTTVVADTSQLSYLSIRPGAKITAIGTASSPIVFTSGASVGSRTASDWGGIVIHGQAPCNSASGVLTAADTEINTGSYGGNVEADNSGTLRYVRVEFAGYEIAAGKEFNGIFLAGVGYNTTIDHVQVHRGSDDGIEIFGGGVSISNAILTYNDDDGFDLDDGWHGHANNFVIAKGSNIGDSCIEYDGLGSNAGRVTQSFFSNFTFLGEGAGKKKTLINVKKEGALVIVNSLFANFNNQGLVHQGAHATAADGSFFPSTANNGFTAVNGWVNALQSNRFENVAIGGTAAAAIGSLIFDDEAIASPGDNWGDKANNEFSATMNFTAPTNYWGEGGASDFVPSSATVTTFYTNNITDWAGQTMTLAGTDYVGAIDPAAANWAAGWTAYPLN